MINTATYRIGIGTEEIKYVQTACYSDAHQALEVLSNHPNSSREWASARTLRAVARDLYPKFDTLPVEARSSIERDLRKSSDLFPLSYYYIKARDDCEEKHIRLLYKILKGFPPTSKFVTYRQGRSSVIKDKKEIGIKLRKIPMHILYLIEYVIRLLDEQYHHGGVEFLTALSSCNDLTVNQKMLFLLIHQSNHDQFKVDSTCSFSGGSGVSNHQLGFMYVGDYYGAEFLPVQSAISGIVDGNLKFFEERHPLQTIIFRGKDYKKHQKYIHAFWMGTRAPSNAPEVLDAFGLRETFPLTPQGVTNYINKLTDWSRS